MDRDKLAEEYKSGATVGELARKHSVQDAVISRELKQAGVDVGTYTDGYRALQEESLKSLKLNDRDDLEEMYVERGMTQQEIADEFDVSQSTVSYHLNKRGLAEETDMPDIQRVLELYVDKGYSLEDTAAALGSTTTMVRKALDEAGEETRGRGPTDAVDERLRDRDWLASKVHGEGLDNEELAAEIGCQPRTVRAWRLRLMV